MKSTKQAVSLRLPKSLVQDLKNIATIYGIKYQPMMIKALEMEVQAQFKDIAMEVINKRKAKDVIKA